MAKMTETQVADTMEDELVEATTVKAPKAPKIPKEPKVGPNQVGTKELAEILSTTGRELRMFLRKHFRNMETSKGKTYVWEKGSKELQEVTDAYKAAKSAPKAPKAVKASKAAVAAVAAPAEDNDLEDILIEE